MDDGATAPAHKGLTSSEARRAPATLTATASTGLVVMLKAPANAKRRLAAQIGGLAEEAAAHLLVCALEDALGWPGPTWLSPTDPDDMDWLLSQTKVGAEANPEAAPLPRLTRCRGADHLAGSHHGAICGLILQRGGNLGERLNHVDGELRRRGRWGRGAGRSAVFRRSGFRPTPQDCNHGLAWKCSFPSESARRLPRREPLRNHRVIFVGTDCPGLDSTYLERAARELRQADAVLGPAGDGGVVLMGARRPWPDLSGLSWSTRTLFAELRDVCLDAGWSVATLDARRDVDTLQDLLDAGGALSGDGRRSRRDFAKWLGAHRGTLLARQPDPPRVRQPNPLRVRQPAQQDS